MVQIAAPSQGTQSILQQAKHASEITAFISLSWGGQRHIAVSNVADNSNSTNLNSNKNKRYLTGIKKLQCACWRTALINTCSYNLQHYKHRKNMQELHVGILSQNLDVTHEAPGKVTCQQPLVSLDSNSQMLESMTSFLYSFCIWQSVQQTVVLALTAKCIQMLNCTPHNGTFWGVYVGVWIFFSFRNPTCISACEGGKKDR